MNIQYLDDPRKKNIPPIETNPDGTPKYPKQPYDYPLPSRIREIPNDIPQFPRGVGYGSPMGI